MNKASLGLFLLMTILLHHKVEPRSYKNDFEIISQSQQIPQVYSTEEAVGKSSKHLRTIVLSSSLDNPMYSQTNGLVESFCEDFWTEENISIGNPSDEQGMWYVNNCFVYTASGWANATKIEWNFKNTEFFKKDYWVCKNSLDYKFYYPEDCTWIHKEMKDFKP